MHRVRAAAGRLGSRLASVLGAEIEKKIAGVVVTGLAAYIYTKEQHIAVLPLSQRSVAICITLLDNDCKRAACHWVLQNSNCDMLLLELQR